MKLCCDLYFSHDIFSNSTSISIVLKYYDANTRQIIFYLPQIECGAGINSSGYKIYYSMDCKNNRKFRNLLIR